MNEKLYDYMDWPRIEAVVYGEEASPKDVMHPRITKDGVLIQSFFPEAVNVQVVTEKKTYVMEKQDEAGYFAVILPEKEIPEYFFSVEWENRVEKWKDPYQYPGRISVEEERAFCAGVYYEAYKKMGAHPVKIDGTPGTYFAVWAPNAVRVSVVGDFNQWDGRRHPMHRMPMSGIFELFIPGVNAGAIYKYEIKVKGGEICLKADPYGNGTEKPPACASLVTDLTGFEWHDAEWIEGREKYVERCQPLSIYETSLPLWENAQELVDFLRETGYTHVEFKPVMEYLDERTEGYSTSAYYAPTTRFGTAVKFQEMVDKLHQADIGVILDWTPAQFPRFDGGLERFDGTALYEIPDKEYAVHPFWGTMLYNYDSPMVRDFLIANACFWVEVYHADGIRMDDVDAMLYLDYGRAPGMWNPNFYGTNENLYAVEFLKHLNSIMKKRNPGVLLIAQEDGLWPELTDYVENDHIGFDYKWSGGWTKDFLEYLSVKPEQRSSCHDQLTLSMLYAYCEHYVLTLGSRDVGSLNDFSEKLWGNNEQKAAQIRAAYSYMFLHPGCKMSAPDKDMPCSLKKCIKDLNDLYCENPALWKKDDECDGFQWIQLMKYEERVITFLRKTEDPKETILAICNFSDISYEKYRTGIPFFGTYQEIFNSDLKKYGGNSETDTKRKNVCKGAMDGYPYFMETKLPALSVMIFSCEPEKEDRKEKQEMSGKKTRRKKK